MWTTKLGCAFWCFWAVCVCCCRCKISTLTIKCIYIYYIYIMIHSFRKIHTCNVHNHVHTVAYLWHKWRRKGTQHGTTKMLIWLVILNACILIIPHTIGSWLSCGPDRLRAKLGSLTWLPLTWAGFGRRICVRLLGCGTWEALEVFNVAPSECWGTF